MSNPQQVQESSATGTATGTATATVCCGCRPRRRKWEIRKSWSPSFALRRIGRSKSDKYLDAEVGNDSEWDNANGSDTDSMFFFDAVPEELGPDDYPIVVTTELKHPAPRVSLDQPETLLRQTTTCTPPTAASPAPPRRQESAPIECHRTPSTRFERITRRPTEEFKRQLESPRVKIPLQGYPGDLTVQELAECQKFLRGLKLLDPSVSEQIYSMRDVEDEPYTICRWLRATKFDADKILKRCEENQPMFDEAKEHDFYPNVSEAIGGAPFSVFLSQYPFLQIGSAKNGCPVNYFQVGKIHPEGIMACTTKDKLKGYFWWSFMHKMKQEMRKAQSNDPDFVRLEGINILDLEGLSASALSQETMDVIQLASKISDFFPETLHCMLILNAPGFFAMMWGVIKKFIDPRTAQRIQVVSGKAKGLAALQKIIATEEIPVDYGGTNTSIRDAFTSLAADPALLRQEVQLVYVGRKKVVRDKIKWELDASEVMAISIFTRSVSSAKISIQLFGTTVATVPAARCSFDEPAAETNPHCTSLLAIQNLSGPGTVTVEVADLDDTAKQNSACSRGYFLLVGDVKKRNQKAIDMTGSIE